MKNVKNYYASNNSRDSKKNDIRTKKSKKKNYDDNYDDGIHSDSEIEYFKITRKEEEEEEESIYKIPLSQTSIEQIYFPKTDKVISRENEGMWKLISEIEENLQYSNSTEYIEKLLNSVNSIKRPDIRLATLIEVGNLAANGGKKQPYRKARDYINEIIEKLDPNFALKGMTKYMQRYCDFENNKYVPSYYECRRNRGAIYILVDVTRNIKGGEKSLRDKTEDICKMLYDYIEEFRIKEMQSSERKIVIYDI